jgi:hypothetical protein
LATLTPIAILGVNTHTSESERFLYLPSAFLCLLIVFVLPNFLSLKYLKATYLILALSSCFFLYQSAVVYKIASSWTSTSLQEISKHPGNYKTIHLHQLPSQYKGGFIFRLGIEDAIKWICPDVHSEAISIHSTHEIMEPVKLSAATHQKQSDASSKLTETMDLEIRWTTDSIFIRNIWPE